MVNTVFIIVFGIPILFPIIYIIKKKGLEYKSSCLICWKNSIKYCLFYKWNGVR